MSTFTRRRRPPDGKSPRWYEGCLRLDFEFRCAYCLIHEANYQGHESFQVDHFRPKSRFGDLDRAYSNLYYACILCNKTSRKGANWPSEDETNAGERFVDPCSEDWEEHVEFLEDGSARPLTPAGRYSLRILDLDREQLRAHRRKFPGEYANRSALRALRRRLERVLSLATADRQLPRELRYELRVLEERFVALQEAVRAAWLRKSAPPPEPRCPY
jgi:uncharacterized protein (TIGR02646 family)